MKCTILLVMMIIKFNNKYYIPNRNPHNFSTGSNNIWGGTIGSHLDLTNEFMITFWYKYTKFIPPPTSTTYNKVPFFTLYNSQSQIIEFVFDNISNRFSTFDDKSKFFNFITAEPYFFKLNLIQNTNLNITLSLFRTNFNTVTTQTYIINSTDEIDNYSCLINRLDLNIDFIIENLVFYNTTQNYTDRELFNGPSNILYFINFRHNYPYTKWIKNEIKNEFGPCLNGNNSYFNNNIMNASFNSDTKEIIWETSNKDGVIMFNESIKAYMAQFNLNRSFNVYLNFDIFINYINSSSVQTKSIKIEYFQIFDIKLLILFNTYSHNNQLEISFIVKGNTITERNIKRNTLNFSDYNQKYIGLRYMVLNFTDILSSTSGNYNLNLISHFKSGSNLCSSNNLCMYEVNHNIDHGASLNTGNIKLYLNSINSDIYEKEFALLFIEFSLGLGNFKFKSKDVSTNRLIVESENIINQIIILNSSIEKLERRNGLNNNKNHSACTSTNCSICRLNFNICEYCYKNYYLSSGNCIENTDNTKIVNNFSLRKTITGTINSYDSITITGTPIEYQYNTDLGISSLSGYNLFSIKIHLEYSILNNIISYFKTDSSLTTCTTINSFSYPISKWNSNSEDFNIVIPISINTCLDNIEIWNYKRNFSSNNSLSNFKVEYNKENWSGCTNLYIDYPCEISCAASYNSTYFIKFNNSLYIGTCENSTSINNFVKNDTVFLYYYNCPLHCTTCNITSSLITCTACESGYILNNKECILILINNCNTTSSPTLSNNYTDKNIFICNNFCTNISTYANKSHLLRFYSSSKTCDNKDIVVVNCWNKLNNYYDYFSGNCVACNNCLNQTTCTSCNDTNLYEGCSAGYINFKITKCILTTNYNDSCTNYILSTNYVCNTCANGKFLSGSNNCNNCDSNCVTCNTSATTCLTCANGRFLSGSNTCDSCNSNCVTCNTSATTCLTCASGRFLSGSNICDSCNSNCITCNTSSTTCLTCASGKYLTTSNTCNNCDSNCLTCNTSSTTCLTCASGKYLTTSNTCNNCDSNCLTCNTSSTTCLTCASGKYLTTSNTCNNCDSNCLTCNTSSTNCLTCANGKYLTTSNTCNNCNSNCVTCITSDTNCKTCINGKYLTASNICDNCDSNCLTCINKNNFCNSCNTNLYIYNNKCYARNIDVCTTFINNSHFCQICASGFYKNNDNYCVARNTLNCKNYIDNSWNCKDCIDNYYLNNSLNCVNCIANCKKCINNWVCITCNNNFYIGMDYLCYPRNTEHCKRYRFSSYICDLCNDGYYLSYSNFNCIPCSNWCKTCIINNNRCSSCHVGYDLLTINCIPNKNKIKNCSMFNSLNTCNICKKGYYLNNINTCSQCKDNCIECDNITSICRKCKLYFKLISNDCIPYPKHCIVVNPENIYLCSKCFLNYYLSKTFSCIRCNNNCKSCLNNSYNCIKCKKNSEIVKNKTNNYCKINCLSDIKYFDIPLKRCIICEIGEIKKLKKINKSNFNLNETKSYNNFIILNIPTFISNTYIDIDIIKSNIYIKLNNNKFLTDYLIYLNNKKNQILWIPEINSYLSEITLNLSIEKNIFSKFYKCDFKKENITYTWKNLNIKNYKNQIILKTNRLYSLHQVNSKNYNLYKEIFYYFNIIYGVSISLLFIFSLYNNQLLYSLSFNLSFLMNFYILNYLIKYNWGKNINTIINFLNLNIFIFDVSTILNINLDFFNRFLIDFFTKNYKLSRLETIHIYKISILYIFLILFFMIYVFLKFFNFILNLIKNKIIKKNNAWSIEKSNIKTNIKNNNSKFNIQFSKNDSYIRNINNITKIINFFRYLKNIIAVYMIFFYFIEFPHLILINLIYFKFYYFKLLDIILLKIFIMVLINYFLFYYFLFLFKKIYKIYFDNNYSYFYIEYYYKNVLNLFIPVFNKRLSNIVYYRLVEFLKILISYIILINFTYYDVIITFVIILFEVLFFIYLLNLLYNEMNIIFIKIKQIILVLYLVIIFAINLYGLNETIEIMFVSLFLLILFLSIVEIIINLFIEIYKSSKVFIYFIKKIIKRRKINRVFDKVKIEK